MKKSLSLIILFLSISFFLQAQTTVKKVMLEDFTGTWCGWCPEGTVILENILAANPTTFIPIASHSGDALEIPDGAAIDAALLVSSYPNGAVDRFKFPSQAKIPMSRGQWTNSFNTRKALPAIVSVSFANPSYNGTTYSATINVKFTSAPTASVPLKMNVYVLEDSIAATGTYEQDNYSSAVQGGADPLTNWFHNATLRKALGGAWGFATTIPATPVVGTVYSENVSFVLPATWKKNNVHLVAYVAYDGTVALNQKEILNVEQYPLKSFGPTSVRDLSKDDMQLALYPNPAKANSYIKFAFELKEDATVTMEVLNAFGQVVSKPYSSFEIAGAHTIQWNSLEYGASFPAGMYFVRISTDKGSSSVAKLVVE